MKKINTGISWNNPTAATWFQLTGAVSLSNWLMKTGILATLVPTVKVKGIKKADQPVMKVKMARAAMPGLTWNDDFPPHAKARRAVDQRGAFHVPGQVVEKALHQPDTQRQLQGDHHQGHATNGVEAK